MVRGGAFREGRSYGEHNVTQTDGAATHVSIGDGEPESAGQVGPRERAKGLGAAFCYPGGKSEETRFCRTAAFVLGEAAIRQGNEIFRD